MDGSTTTKKNPTEAQIKREKEKARKVLARKHRTEATTEKKLRKTKRRLQLIPDMPAGELRLYMASQIQKDAGKAHERGLSGVYVYYGKRDKVIVVDYNSKKNLILLRIEGPQDWRGKGYFYYNPNTEKYSQFDWDTQKLEGQEESIIWVNGLGGEHLLGKGYAELILTQELARLKAKKENDNDGFSTMRDIDKEPEAKKPMNSYQKRKAKELAIKFGVTDLDTVTDAMGLETKEKK